MNQIIEENLVILRTWYSESKDLILKGYKSTLLYEYTNNLDLFDSLFLYTCILFGIIYIFRNVKLPRKDYNQSIYQYFYSSLFLFLIKYAPGLNAYINKKKAESLVSLGEAFCKLTTKKTFKLPENGMTEERIESRLEEWSERDRGLYGTGKISGGLYISNDKKFEENVQEFTKHFVYANPMHADIWPATRQMEAEVIKMTADMFGQDKEAYGIITTGGTESIMLAMLAYRNWGIKEKGLTKTNIILPETAHPAFHKAADYFQIEVRIANIDYKNYKVKLNHLKSIIDSETVCIVASYPNFPFGTYDPVQEIALIAKKKKIGLHVDACLGGFVIAFAKQNGYDIGDFDFRVDGVTSISCDQHKYGLAPKGVSTVLFKNQNLRQYAFFGIATWSGGVYAVPSMCGSKSGVAVSGAWYVMQTTGRKKYAEQSKKIMEAAKQYTTLLKEIPEIEVCGNPQICVVSFKSRVSWLNIYSVHSILTHQGWVINTTQKPAGIHVSLTLSNITGIKQLVQDIKAAIQTIKSNPQEYKKNVGSMGTLYGTTQKIPDSRFAGDTLKTYLDCVLKV